MALKSGKFFLKLLITLIYSCLNHWIWIFFSTRGWLLPWLGFMGFGIIWQGLFGIWLLYGYYIYVSRDEFSSHREIASLVWLSHLYCGELLLDNSLIRIYFNNKYFNSNRWLNFQLEATYYCLVSWCWMAYNVSEIRSVWGREFWCGSFVRQRVLMFFKRVLLKLELCCQNMRRFDWNVAFFSHFFLFRSTAGCAYTHSTKYSWPFNRQILNYWSHKQTIYRSKQFNWIALYLRHTVQFS